MPQSPRRLYRRVHRKQIQGDDLTRGAFTPNSNDTDGISLFDARLTTPQAVKEDTEQPAGEYRVVEISEAQLWDLGFTVTPTRDDAEPGELPGHVVVPEFSHQAYSADKGKFREAQDALRADPRFVD